MSLAHFITEAKKNTPVLGKLPVAKAPNTVSSPEKPPVGITVTAVSEPEMPVARGTDLRLTMAEISEADKAVAEANKRPAWHSCQYLKSLGQRKMCTQYLSLCAQEKCKKEFMETDFFDFKKHLKHGKSIK